MHYRNYNYIIPEPKSIHLQIFIYVKFHIIYIDLKIINHRNCEYLKFLFIVPMPCSNNVLKPEFIYVLEMGNLHIFEKIVTGDYGGLLHKYKNLRNKVIKKNV